MGKAKGRTRQDRRLVEMTPAEPEAAEGYWQGDPEGANDYPFTLDVPPLGRFLVRHRLDASWQLIEFSISAQIDLGNGDWRTMARGCSEHGVVHIHFLRLDGDEYDRSSVRQITCQQDVDDGYDYLVDELTKRWDDLVRGCRGR